MTISRASYSLSVNGSTNQNSYSHSLTASAGQRIIASVHYRNASGSPHFSVPVWNSQTFVPLGDVVAQGDSFFRSYYLDVVTGGTGNVTATATGFTHINTLFAVYSSTIGWGSPPTLQTDFFKSGTYRTPSITASLDSSKLAVTVLNGLGWTSSYSDVNGVWTSNAPITAIADVDNLGIRACKRMYFGEGVGNGSTDLSLTPTGSPMWAYSVIVIAESNFQVTSFTDPIIPGASASGTQTGYVDGAITADFEGITFTGTVSGGNVSGTVAGFVDGGLCPLLPATGVTCTFTQSGNNASITRDLSTPTGLQELRDGGGTPANFSGIVLGDPKYIGQSFADAGNPLTTLDRSYVDPSYGLTIDQDGRVRLNATDHPTDPVPSLPYTTTLWIRRGADGRVYSHNLTIDAAGVVVSSGSGKYYLGLGLGIGF